MARRPSTLILSLVVALLVSTGTAADAASGKAPPASSCQDASSVPGTRNAARIRAATLCLVNRERTQRGRPKLERNRTLERVATGYTVRMVQEGFFEHVSPDGGTLTDRVQRTSYLRGSFQQWSLGENLAWGTGRLATPKSIVAGWMKSPGHRRNILDHRFREAGFGVIADLPDTRASGAAGTYTNVFGQRVRR